MDFYVALGLIFGFFLVYLLVIEIFCILFRLTGLTKEKCSFQVISLLTNSGFTTKESEVITSVKSRRVIAKAAMVVGYSFSVIIVSLIINLVISIGSTKIYKVIVYVFILILLMIIIIFVFKIKFINKIINVVILKIVNRKKNMNIITLIDTYENNDISLIVINVIPKILEGKKLYNSNLKELYNINILLVKSGKGKMSIPLKDYIIKKNDSILVFGPARTIREVFEIKIYD